MFKKCEKCSHLITGEPHECPSPEYLEAKRILIEQALDERQEYTPAELEKAKWAIRAIAAETERDNARYQQRG